MPGGLPGGGGMGGFGIDRYITAIFDCWGGQQSCLLSFTMHKSGIKANSKRILTTNMIFLYCSVCDVMCDVTTPD